MAAFFPLEFIRDPVNCNVLDSIWQGWLWSGGRVWWHCYFLPGDIPSSQFLWPRRFQSNALPTSKLFYPISHRVHGRVMYDAALPCRLDLLVSQSHSPCKKERESCFGMKLQSGKNGNRLKWKQTFLPAPLLASYLLQQEKVSSCWNLKWLEIPRAASSCIDLIPPEQGKEWLNPNTGQKNWASFYELWPLEKN